jgi:hypothetical protein
MSNKGGSQWRTETGASTSTTARRFNKTSTDLRYDKHERSRVATKLGYMVGLKGFRSVRARSTSHFFAMWICRFLSRYGRVTNTTDGVTS